MISQVLSGLDVTADEWYIDATFGRGGHTRQILDSGGKVIALDFDQEAIEYGQKKFTDQIEDQNLILVRENFARLDQTIEKVKKQHAPVSSIKGILFDFGTSQDQLKSPDRGFSFDQPDSELDMRMDQRLGVKAKDLLQIMTVEQLTRLFKQYGGERQAKSIAKAIARFRGKNRQNKIETVGQLVDIIEQVKQRQGKLHPATKVFQALRIVVNTELENIKQGLQRCPAVLDQPARIVTIAFHEGEDRIAKQQFKDWAQAGQGKILTDKPLQADDQEVKVNPSARSAKLRVFELTTNN
jgi:16S rRNA (cytosine1402-N4)-methyltransferase